MKFSYEDLFNECNDAAWNFEFALLFLKNFVFYCRKITAYYCSVSESYRSKRSKKGEKFMLRQWIEIIGNNCKYLFYSIKDGDMWSEKYEKNEVYGTQLIKKRDLMSHLKDLVLFGIVWGLALWGWGGGGEVVPFLWHFTMVWSLLWAACYARGDVFGVYGAMGWDRCVSLLRPFAGCLGRDLDFLWGGALQGEFNIYFSGVFLVVLKKFSFWETDIP